MKNINLQGESSIVPELIFLRCVACLAVVMIHAAETSLEAYADTAASVELLSIHLLRMAMMFGTPTFIFLSEFLLAKSYPDNLPTGFFEKRVKLLLIPYVSMSVIYAVAWNTADFSLSAIGVSVVKNIFIGDSTVYFILIVFQFYFLHLFLHRHLQKWKKKIVLTASLAVNMLYLGFFNFVTPFRFFPHSSYIWYRFSWIPFFGWVFYFILGFYCGKHYQYIKMQLVRYRKWIFAAPAVTLALVLFFRYMNFPATPSSKRIDIIFYTTAMIFALMYLFRDAKTIHPLIMTISNYSFGIFLTHKLFMHFFLPIPQLNIYFYTIVVFLSSIGLSIAVTFLVNKHRWGKYIVGRIYSFKGNNQQETPERERNPKYGT
ncbi:Membrane-bound acyltransferase YfiQ, involved in biofilm formation [Evansella caseinilytica]|uniref:Membrane-bound acyltransferase YfiQ, involved in biofilm formation n=1 Tax=Evansella caseinilytica TaxID=1503961 RepID=A0A1H3ULK9_9BACI|nr:acyltransferase family protein [Evansella caseinilytica]SDZ63342.1 Membrane-bound acyltransferase YfiQ, involved in biofilm formation [Evansella caseinilytica]